MSIKIRSYILNEFYKKILGIMYISIIIKQKIWDLIKKPLYPIITRLHRKTPIPLIYVRRWKNAHIAVKRLNARK